MCYGILLSMRRLVDYSAGELVNLLSLRQKFSRLFFTGYSPRSRVCVIRISRIDVGIVHLNQIRNLDRECDERGGSFVQGHQVVDSWDVPIMQHKQCLQRFLNALLAVKRRHTCQIALLNKRPCSAQVGMCVDEPVFSQLSHTASGPWPRSRSQRSSTLSAALGTPLRCIPGCRSAPLR